MIRRAVQWLMPTGIDGWLRRMRFDGAPPPPGAVHFGDLRRLTPISRAFGFDRGQPVDRYYIEGFLERHAPDVRGRVLEVGDDSYTRRFGGDQVTRRDVLHVHEGNPNATIVADLARGDAIPSAAFDCVILTQTLHLVYDMHAAAATLRRILAPGGVCLITVPGISQVDVGAWRETWHWSFTTTSLARLLGDAFGAQQVTVEASGNVLAATAFLYGLSATELTRAELDAIDASYPVTVTARAAAPVDDAR
jgi:SAM-dependent methyltransferase